MTWEQPRQPNGHDHVWMDLNEWSAPGILRRCGRVSWKADGTGYYKVDISYEDIGLGLPCWPSFRALSDAQEFVERLFAMSVEEVTALHGTQWPGVVL